VTEDEAKTKWCPFASSRVLEWSSGPNQTTTARFVVGTDEKTQTLCIASACMAWRAGSAIKVPADLATLAAYIREHNVGPLDASRATSRMVETGYCGLAGAPQ